MYINTCHGENRLHRAKRIFIIFLFSLSVATMHAQNGIGPRFEYYSVDNGLSENSITATIQDRHGFIWIGTGEGLNRYDGYSFITYRKDPDDRNGLSSNVIKFLFEDSKGGLWVGTNVNLSAGGGPGKLNRLNRATGTFECFEHDPNNPHSISSNAVTNIFEDSKKNIWICTKGGGLNRYNYQTGQFQVFRFSSKDHKSEKANSIDFIMEDARGTLWMGTAGIDFGAIAASEDGSATSSEKSNAGAGLVFLDAPNGKLKRYRHNPNDPNSLSSNAVVTILEDSNNTLWIGTINGLNRLDRTTGRFEHFMHDPNDPQSLSSNLVRQVFEDSRKNLWIATPHGLNRMDRSTGKFQRYQYKPGTPGSLCHNSVENILEDHAGNLWIKTEGNLALMDYKNGTFQCVQIGRNTEIVTQDRSGNFWLGSSWVGAKGLSKMDIVSTNFQHFQHNPHNSNSLIDNAVWPIIEDSDGNVWIGTMPSMDDQNRFIGGLDRLDRVTGKFEHFQHDENNPESIYKNQIFSLFEDSKGFLWVGYNAGVLDRLDRRTGNVVERFIRRERDPATINISPVTRMLEDSQGNLWLGGGSGINKLDKATGLFQHFVPFPDAENLWGGNWIDALIEDSEGYIWVGTWWKGLCRLNPETGKFDYFEHDPNDPESLSNNGVWALYEDAGKNIWAGTGEGLSRLNRATGKFTSFYDKDGLPSSYIYGILPDKHGRLWLSTHNGIACFDLKTGISRNFDVQDGLQSNQFNHFSYFKSPRTGEFLFGGNNGFNILHPDSLRVDSFAPLVAITSFTRYDPKDATPILDEFISEREVLILTHKDNVVSFEFAALNFRKTNKTRYRYQLVGFSNRWFELGNKREVTFTGLHPGNYTLRVEAANTDGIWSRTPTELAIQVLPPWYWSSWSKLLYLLAGAGLLFGFYRFQLNRKLALAEARNLKELDSVKTKFYTNITHEFRTPLTVIQGLSDQLIEKAGELPKEKITDNARIVKRNSAQLLTMVNQMLDLRRLESGNMPVNLVKGDVLKYFRYLTESFHSYAYDKGVGLHFMTDLEELNMDYDPDK
ncbi:MAG: sensor histidine kinase, partial [Bacteroidetes bacterium]